MTLQHSLSLFLADIVPTFRVNALVIVWEDRKLEQMSVVLLANMMLIYHYLNPMLPDP